MRGGEKCLEVLCELYPDAEIFTLLHNHGSVSDTIERHHIHTSILQHLPLASTKYRSYLPLFPFAISGLNLEGFDLIISSSHCVAKGVNVPEGVLHICYCHTPMRYIWHLYDDYFGPGKTGLATRLAMRAVVDGLRKWDVRTASSPHYFIANSHNVRMRIRELYKREADVIYPPVQAADVVPSFQDRGYFLMVTAMVPYKRVDIAIQAFNRMQKHLVVVGTGPELNRLKAVAGPAIEFRGWATDAEIDSLYDGCTALVFPGEEDFGIVPVEAMAHGKPVIAFAKGGALETVREEPEGRTGVLFEEQTAEALLAAVQRCAALQFNPTAIRDFSLQFDRQKYRAAMRGYIDEKWKLHREDPSTASRKRS